MADTKNFRSEYGFNSGTTEVINSSGKVVAAAVSTLDTDDISEGSSAKYFTTTRVDTHLADATEAKTIRNATIDGGTF
jgi:hypothetical protein